MFIPENVVSLNDSDRIKSEFNAKDYPKLTSIVRLRAVGLPILPGFAIREVTPEIVDFATNWISETKSERLSFRFDSPNPEDHKRLTLSNPTLDEFKKFSALIIPPVIGLLLAENDRFKQRHSVLTQFGKDSLICEVVGPGFDAADLTRGRVSPHERIEITRKGVDSIDSELRAVDIERHKITDQNDYEQSRKLRYATIFSVLSKGVGKYGSVRNLTPEDIMRVDDFLLGRGAQVPEEYEPIGFEKLSELYEYVNPLSTFRDYYKKTFKLEVENRVLSSSFLRNHGLVFWDLYGPDKYRPK